MSADAIIVMLIAMTILWGGLVLAVLRLNRHVPRGDEIHRDL